METPDLTDQYDWKERRWYIGHAPEGMCWSVREMFSYGTELSRFIPHLQAMAEGLERAHFETFDCDDQFSSYDSEENFGMFVIGLRPLGEDDKTEAQLRAERKEREERELLAELQKKYADAD